MRLPGYGQFMRRLSRLAVTQFRRFGADRRLTRQLRKLLASSDRVFAASTGPVFAHDDLHPLNILAGRGEAGQLRLTGLVDFGNARAADPVFDLAKTMLMCDLELPGAGAAIRTGYGTIEHPEPDEAVRAYMLIHAMLLWGWYRAIGTIAEGQPHEVMTTVLKMAAEMRVKRTRRRKKPKTGWALWRARLRKLAFWRRAG